MVGHYILAYLGTLTTIFMLSMLMDFLKQEKLRPSIVRSRVVPAKEYIPEEHLEVDEDMLENIHIIDEPQEVVKDSLKLSDNIFDNDIQEKESSELSFSMNPTGAALSGVIDSGISIVNEDDIIQTKPIKETDNKNKVNSIHVDNTTFNLSSIIVQKDSNANSILELDSDAFDKDLSDLI